MAHIIFDALLLFFALFPIRFNIFVPDCLWFFIYFVSDSAKTYLPQTKKILIGILNIKPSL